MADTTKTDLPGDIKSISENTAIAALCIYEFVVEKLENKDEFWCECQNSSGARELRQSVLNIAPHIDAAWSYIDNDIFQMSFDWEFVPELMSVAVEREKEELFLMGAEYWKALSAEIYCIDSVQI